MNSSGYSAVPGTSVAGITTRTLSHGGSISVISHDPLEYTYVFRRSSVTIVCALLAAVGGLTFGYDQGVIANVLVMPDFLARFPVTPAQIGWMTAVLELGALFGALSASFVADMWSRRYAICIASAIFCVGSAMQAAANTFGFLTLGRAVGGVGVGALSSLAPLYITEISAPDIRGRLLALEQLAICTGVVIGFWAGYFTRTLDGSTAWRLPLAIQAIPGIVLGFGCLALPPSPRYLVLRNDIDGAQKSLSRLRGVPEDDLLLQLELLEIQVDVQLSKGASWSSLWTQYRPRTIIGLALGFFQQWSGINALIYYSALLMAKLGLGSATLIAAGGIGIIQALAAAPAIALIDTVGRRPLYIYGAAGMAVVYLGVSGLTWKYDQSWDEHPVAGYTVVALLYVYTFVYGVSLGPITWILPAEIFPTSVRSRGVSLSTGSTWFNNFLVGLVTPVLIEKSPSFTYALFSASCFFAAVWSARTLPETRGRSLEDIDRAFGTQIVLAEETEYRRKVEEQVGLPGLVRDLLEMDEDA